MTRWRVILLLGVASAGAVAAALVGCPRSRAADPASPSAASPVVTVIASPAPLVALHDAAGGATRFQVAADLSFREVAGQPARITKLRVDVVAPSGWSTTATYDADIVLAAYGVASRSLTTVIDAAGPSASAKWLLTASAVTLDGQPVPVATVESELRFTPASLAAPDEVFVGAGDIAKCGAPEPEATAKLLDRIPGTVFTLGDNAQGSGSAAEYAECYAPTWGRHLSRTFPTVGNHDWDYTGGGPYFAYFGPSAGPPGRGYYSYDLGSWHIISINSQIAAGAGSTQYQWLKADLAASEAGCTLAMWHKPLFSSGPSGGSTEMRDAWRLLNSHGAELVLSGHDHDYERFAPQDADGHASPSGMREFVVGTGGYSLYTRTSSQPNSEVWEGRTWGVLRLTLKSSSYNWEFVPVDGQVFRDSGSAPCVAPPR
jgi:hypothetical protein